MQDAVKHDPLDDALCRCGATWDAPQAHGLLAGRLAISGAEAGFAWLTQVLDGTDANDALRGECESLLSALFETTCRQLAERQSQFDLLLPDEAESAAIRATGLAHWCEGFLHGLVSAEHADALKERLAAEPLADIIKDLLEITRAAADDEDSETDEQAYAELVEYVRVAVQLTYEELSEFRGTPGTDRVADTDSGAVH